MNVHVHVHVPTPGQFHALIQYPDALTATTAKAVSVCTCTALCLEYIWSVVGSSLARGSSFF